MPEAFSVHVINPRKKTGRKKTTRRKKRGHKKTAKKAAARPKKRSTNSMAKRKTKRRRAPAKRGTSTTRRYTRRRKNPSPAKRRRRRNPSGGGLGSLTSEAKNAIPRMLGMMATAWAVRRWGGSNGLFGTSHQSPMMGDSWGWQQYLIAGAVAAWAPRFVGKWVNPTEFRRGSIDLIMQKFIWTEGFARSEWAQQQFGSDVGVGPYNQAYVQQGDRWAAMQGLVEASPLDGLVEASPLDASPDYQYGHLLPASASSGIQKQGKYSGSGYASNYHAAFAS